MRGRGKRFVIDADVIRSAADPSAASRGGHIDDVALACYRCLSTLLEFRHIAVLSSKLDAEWGRHQGRFALRWRAEMMSRRLVECVENDPDEGVLLSEIGRLLSGAKRRAAEKDVHLVVLACQADKRILSRDERAREAFGRLRTLSKVQCLGRLHWANPRSLRPGRPTTEEVIRWLREKAPAAKKFLLGEG